MLGVVIALLFSDDAKSTIVESDTEDTPMDDASSHGEGSSQPKPRVTRWDVTPEQKAEKMLRSTPVSGMQDTLIAEAAWDKKPSDMQAMMQAMSMDDASSYGEGASQPKVRKESRWDKKPSDMQAMRQVQAMSMDDASSHGEGSSQPEPRVTRWDVTPEQKAEKMLRSTPVSGMQDMPIAEAAWDKKPSDMQAMMQAMSMDDASSYGEEASQPKVRKESRWDKKPSDMQAMRQAQAMSMDDASSHGEGSSQPEPRVTRWDVTPEQKAEKMLRSTPVSGMQDMPIAEAAWDKKPSDMQAMMQAMSMDDASSYGEEASQPKVRKESRWDKKPSDMQAMRQAQAMSMDDASSHGEGSSQPEPRVTRWDVTPEQKAEKMLRSAPVSGMQDMPIAEAAWDKKPSDMQAMMQAMSMDDASSYGEEASQPKVRKESRWDKKPSDMQAMRQAQAMSMDDASSHGEGSSQPEPRVTRWDVTPEQKAEKMLRSTPVSGMQDMPIAEAAWDKKPSDMQAMMQAMSMDDASSHGEGSSQPKPRVTRWDVTPEQKAEKMLRSTPVSGMQDMPIAEAAWDKKPSDMQAMSMDDAPSYGEEASQPKVRKKESRWDVKPSTLGSDTQDKLTPGREWKQRLDVTAGTPTDVGVRREKRRRKRSQSVPISLPSESSPREADRLVKRKRPANELLSVIDSQKGSGMPSGPQKDAANQIDARGLHPSHTGKDHADDSHAPLPSMQGANRVRQRSRSLPVLAPGLEQRRLQADTPLFIPVHTSDDGNPDSVQQIGTHELAWHQSSFTDVPPITVSGIDVSVVDNKVAVLHDASGDTHTPILGKNSSAFENGGKGQGTLAPYDKLTKPYIVDRDDDGWQSGPAPSREMKLSTLGSDTQDKLTPGWEWKQRLNVTARTSTDVGVQREKRRRERSQSVPISLPSESSPREAGRLVKRKRPTNEPLSAIDLQNDNVNLSGLQKDAANQIDARGLHPSHTGKDHADDSHAPLPSMQGANRVRQRSRSLPVLAPKLEQRRLQADTPLFVPVDTFDDGNPDGVQQAGAHELAWHQSSFTDVPPITVSGIDVSVVDNKVAVLHDASGNTHTPILGKNSSAFENGGKGQGTLAPYDELTKPYIVDRDDDGWQSGLALSREMGVRQVPAEQPALSRSSTSTMSDAGADPVSVSQAAVMAKTDNEKRSQVGENIPEPVVSNSSSVLNSVQADQYPNSERAKTQSPKASLSPALTAADKVQGVAPDNRGVSDSAELPQQAQPTETGVSATMLAHSASHRSSASTMSDAGASIGSRSTQSADESRTQPLVQTPETSSSFAAQQTVAEKVRDVAPGNRGRSKSAVLLHQQPQVAKRLRSSSEDRRRSDGLDAAGLEGGIWQSGPAPSREIEVGQVLAERLASPRSSASTMSDAGTRVGSKPTQSAEETHTQLQTLEVSLSPALTAADKVQDVAPGNRGGSNSTELPQQAQPAEPVASVTTLAHSASRRSSMSTMNDAGASIDSRSTQSADESRTQPLVQTPETSSSLAVQQTAAEKVRDAALGSRGRSKSAVLLHQQPQVAKRLRSSSEDRRRSGGLDAAGLEDGIWQSGPAPSREMEVGQVLAEHPALPRSSASTMSDAGARVDSKSTQSADESRTQPLVQTPETSSSFAAQQTVAEKVRDVAPGNRGRSKSAVLLHQQPQVAKRLRSSSEDRRRSDGLDAAGLEDGIWQSGPAPSREMEVGQVLAEHPALPRSSASTMSDAGARVDSKSTQSADESRTQPLVQTPETSSSLAAQQTVAEKVRDVAPGNRGRSKSAVLLHQQPQVAKRLRSSSEDRRRSDGLDAAGLEGGIWQSGPAPSREMEVGQVLAERPASPRSSASTMSDAGTRVDSKPIQFAEETHTQLQTLEASLSPALTAADKVQDVAPGNRGGFGPAELLQQAQPAGQDASATTSAHPASRRSSTSTMSDAGASIGSRSTQSADESRTQPLVQTPETSSSLAAQQTVAEKVRDVAPGNRGRSKSAVLLHQQPQVAKRLRSSSEDRRRSDGLDAAGLEGGIWQSGPAPSREMEVGQVLAERPASPRSSASTMSDAGTRVDSKPIQFAEETHTQLQTLEASLSPALTAADKVQDVAPGNRGGFGPAELLQQAQPAGQDASATTSAHPASRRSSMSTMSDASARVASKLTQSADETHMQLQILEASLSPALTAADKVQDVAPGNRGGSDGAESLQQAQPAGHDASAIMSAAPPASRRSSTSTMSDAGADPVSVSQAAVMAKTDNEKQSQVGENIPEPVASSSLSVSNSVQADQPPNSEPTEMTSLTRPSPSTAAATSRDAAPEQDVLHGWLREAIAAELPSVMTEQLGISVDETRVSVGTPGQERKITHVARGTEPTDAVNKAQLDEAVARVDRDASAGIAAAMAVAGLPQPTLPGKSLAAFAGATYRGQYGAALGISHVTPNNRWVFKLAANANGRGYLGAVASGGFQW
ncbi:MULTISPECIES: YadA family autotransporter adhesin [Burkholderiaceae]|uniref:YadA family autotransporter adhesin n=3 Tax=Burkholderiales TaxID=80840 RepID=UPI000977EFAD|nr:YadA family autotransporter adhesin [Burkholderia sp. b13]